MHLVMYPGRGKSVGINLQWLFYSGTTLAQQPDHLFLITKQIHFYHWILIIAFFMCFTFVFGILAKQ